MKDRFLRIVGGDGYVRAREIKIIKKIITEEIEPNPPCMNVELQDGSNYWVEIPFPYLEINGDILLNDLADDAELIPAEAGWSAAIIEDRISSEWDVHDVSEFELIPSCVTTIPVISWRIGHGFQVIVATGRSLDSLSDEYGLLLLPPARPGHPNHPYAVDLRIRTKTYRNEEEFAEAVREKVKELRFRKNLRGRLNNS